MRNLFYAPSIDKVNIPENRNGEAVGETRYDFTLAAFEIDETTGKLCAIPSKDFVCSIMVGFGELEQMGPVVGRSVMQGRMKGVARGAGVALFDAMIEELLT